MPYTPKKKTRRAPKCSVALYMAVDELARLDVTCERLNIARAQGGARLIAIGLDAVDRDPALLVITPTMPSKAPEEPLSGASTPAGLLAGAKLDTSLDVAESALVALLDAVAE